MSVRSRWISLSADSLKPDCALKPATLTEIKCHVLATPDAVHLNHAEAKGSVTPMIPPSPDSKSAVVTSATKEKTTLTRVRGSVLLSQVFSALSAGTSGVSVYKAMPDTLPGGRTRVGMTRRNARGGRET